MLRSSDLRISAEQRVGKCLKSKWQLDELIGLGGTAAVYAATHRNGSRVAIKVLHRHLCISERQVRRFLREAYTANRVGHPGAVKVHDDDIDGDDAFLVMELLEGSNLKDKAEKNGGTLSVEITLKLADQLLDVLEAAHARGIVHRDIKPSNLFLTESGDLKVLDFGVARCSEPERDAQTTWEGDVIGTPAFMAPEQARGKSAAVTAQADIWSVGATLFTLLSGELVHPSATTASEHLSLAMSVSARSFASVRPGPAALANLIDRCLRYDPDERWPSVSALRAALREPSLLTDSVSQEFSNPDLDPLTTATLPGETKERKARAWGVPAAAAAILIALVVLLAVAPSRDKEPASSRPGNRLDFAERSVMASPTAAEQQNPSQTLAVTSKTPYDVPPPRATLREPEHRSAPKAVRPRAKLPIPKTAPAETAGSTPTRAAQDPAPVKKAPSSNPLDWRH